MEERERLEIIGGIDRNVLPNIHVASGNPKVSKLFLNFFSFTVGSRQA
jgi:hypothetical protein